nr:hypothetical protein [Tanacetum cinerariifolium]
MLGICFVAKPVLLKVPKPSSNAERVSHGINPGAQPGHKKHSTSSKQPSMSSGVATKGGSSKAPTSSITGHLERKKYFSSTMESIPSQTLAFTPVVAKMHKEDQQVTDGPNSLGVTSKERADPQLSSGMSVFNQNKPIYSASFIIHTESASGNDALADSTAKVNPRKSAPSDFIPQQQGMNEGNKNNSYDHLLAGRSLKYNQAGESRKAGAKFQPSFKDLDSPEDDYIIVVDDSDEDEEADRDEGLLATSNIKIEDAPVPKSSSPSRSLPTELKKLPSKFNELAEEAKLRTLDALPSQLNKVTNALNQFAQAIASKKTDNASVLSAGQASTRPA